MMISLQNYFDRVVIINLDRRSDRWRQINTALEKMDWPFCAPQRMPAVDGDAVTVPIWWKQGGGAWGCLMSHARILEDCIREGVKRVLIMEDDAVFFDTFIETVSRFLQNVPQDWDQLYFGGQHLRDPIRLNDHVYECVNVNRTHCYAVSAKFMPRMYRYILNAYDYIEHPGNHIDHRLGALHESGTVKVYAPIDWPVGQCEGSSNISGRTNTTYFWNTWAGVPDMTMHIVLGLHEGHAQQIGGLLQSIGVHFGHTLGGFRPPFIEDAGLARICEQIMPFPHTDRELPMDDSVPLLYDWCRLILQEAANYGTVGAAHYPHLCALYDDMSRAWRNLKVIDVVCPLEEAIEALYVRVKNNTGWPTASYAEVEEIQRMLEARKEQWRVNCDCISIDPKRIITDRYALVEQLRSFVGVKTRVDGLSAFDSSISIPTVHCLEQTTNMRGKVL